MDVTDVVAELRSKFREIVKNKTRYKEDEEKIIFVFAILSTSTVYESLDKSQN